MVWYGMAWYGQGAPWAVGCVVSLSSLSLSLSFPWTRFRKWYGMVWYGPEHSLAEHSDARQGIGEWGAGE